MILLQTKLFAPVVQTDSVVRTRLLKKISKSESAVTIVTAPAGSGKTTVICQWLNTLKTPYGWYSIDNSDNDPIQFLAYVRRALKLSEEEEWELLLLGNSVSVDDLFTELLNEISTQNEKLTLILDDYHLIDNEEINSNLIRWIEYLPRNLKLIFISREKLPMTSARLKSQQKIQEISNNDLAFTSDECNDFFHLIPELSLKSSTIELLHKKTEGWAAGLQLSALSMAEGNGNITDNRHTIHISEYMMQEVINSVSEPLANFLIITSLLSRFNSKLCQYVTENKESKELLNEIRQKNIFLIPLDNKGVWFRYHHLLNSSLQVKISDKKKMDIYKKAALWCEENSLLEEAYEYACQAEEYSLALEIFEKMDFVSWSSTITPHSYTLLMQLPEQFRNSSILAQIHLAREFLAMTQFGEALLLIDHIEVSLAKMEESHQKRVLSGRTAVITASVALTIGDFSLVSKTLQRCENHLAVESDHYWRCTTLYIISGIHLNFGDGDVRRADELNKQACVEAELQGSKTLITLSYFFRLLSLGALGDSSQIGTVLKHFDSLVPTSQHDSPIKKLMYQELAGETEAAQGNPQKACSIFQSALEYAAKDKRIKELNLTSLRVRHAISALMLNNFDKEGSVDSVLKIKGLFPWVANQALVYKMRVSILNNRKSELQNQLNTLEISQENPKMPAHAQGIYTLYGAALLFKKEYKQAQLFLEKITTHLYKGEFNYEGVEAHLLWTISLFRNEDPQFSEVLKELLTKSFSMNILRQFFLWTEWSLQMLNEAAAMRLFENMNFTISKSEVDKLIKSLRRVKEKYYSQSPETLSDRECEVLQYAADGKSNQEIAELMFISENTVKTHLKKINSKLNVKNRTEAAARAQELLLI